MQLTADILEITTQTSDTPSSSISSFLFFLGGGGSILWKIFYQRAL